MILKLLCLQGSGKKIKHGKETLASCKSWAAKMILAWLGRLFMTTGNPYSKTRVHNDLIFLLVIAWQDDGPFACIIGTFLQHIEV